MVGDVIYTLCNVNRNRIKQSNFIESIDLSFGIQYDSADDEDDIMDIEEAMLYTDSFHGEIEINEHKGWGGIAKLSFRLCKIKHISEYSLYPVINGPMYCEKYLNHLNQMELPEGKGVIIAIHRFTVNKEFRRRGIASYMVCRMLSAIKRHIGADYAIIFYDFDRSSDSAHPTAVSSFMSKFKFNLIKNDNSIVYSLIDDLPKKVNINIKDAYDVGDK